MKVKYKVVDTKGRIIIPKDIREKLDLNEGDIVGITLHKDVIQIEKVNLIQLNDDSVQSLIDTVMMCAKKMDKESLFSTMGRLFELIQKEEENE